MDTRAPCASDQNEEGAKAWQVLEISSESLIQGSDQAWPALVTALQEVALPVLRAYWRRLDPKEKHSTGEDAARDIFVRVLERMRSGDFAAIRRYFAPQQSQSHGSKNGEEIPERGSFAGYIKTILRRAAVDYQRLEPRYRRASRAKRSTEQSGGDNVDQGKWRSFVSAHSRVGAVRDPVTMRATAIKMLEYLDSVHESAIAFVEQMVKAERHNSQRAIAKRRMHESLASLLGLRVKTGPKEGELDWAAARDILERGAHYREALELEIQGHTQDEIAEILGLSRRMTQTLLNHAKSLLRIRFCDAVGPT